MGWFAFEDLIYPLFIFIVGVSIVFSLSKALSQSGRGRVMARVVSRSCLLYLLGLIACHGFDQPIHGFAGQTRAHHAMRWFGVLQRIAICYCFAATLFCLLRARYLVLTTIILLVGYWVLMAYVNVPGAGRGSFAEGKNLANYLDQKYLGGFKYDGDHDPEGYLSNLPAIASCLLGVFAGKHLRDEKFGPYAKGSILIFAGAALAATGYAWGFLPSPVHFPVIKKNLDIVFRTHGRRLQRDDSRPVLSRDRRGEIPRLGDAVRLDWHQCNHAVHADTTASDWTGGRGAGWRW